MFFTVLVQPQAEKKYMAKKNENAERAIVLEAFPGLMFKIRYLSDGYEELAVLAGKLRRVRIMVGDEVEVVPDEYGGKARIVNRIIKKIDNNN